MAQGSQAPYGRVRKRKLDDYQLLKSNLDYQLAQTQANVDRYYDELHRLLNPVLAGNNPKASDVSVVVAYLTALSNYLVSIESALTLYDATYVEQVDRLISAFLQQGAKRAVDLLLECGFSSFFGISQDDASYAGAVQSAIRVVNQQDLNQSKLNRPTTTSGVLMDTWQDPDFEYDLSDVSDER
jgi:hypothetical protein